MVVMVGVMVEVQGGTYGLAARELLDEPIAVPSLRWQLAQQQQLLP